MAKLHVPVTADDHALGDPGAPVTLLEYGDFQCPHCAMAHSIVQQIQRHYGTRLRFVYRHFPLTEIHPLAEMASEAAEFAGAHGKFWQMHDAIFAHQRRLGLQFLVDEAEKLGLDGQKLEAAVENQQFADRIQADIDGALQCGVHATPTFFINGQQYEGAWDYDELVAAIHQVL